MSSKLAIEEMDTLRRLTLEITSELDRDKLLNTIIVSATKLLGATGAGVYEYMPCREELKVVADCGMGISIKEHTLKVGEGLSGQVLKAHLSGQATRERSGMRVDDYDGWEFRSPQIKRGVYKAVAADVLKAPGDRILGVLYVTNNAEGPTFSDRDMLLLSLLASHAAIAMRNAEILAEKQLSLTQLELTNTFDESIRAAFSLEQLLRITLKEALTAVGAVDGSIMILDHEQKVLKIEAGMVQGGYREKEHPEFPIGQGIAGQVAATGEEYNCRDTSKDPNYQPSFTGRDIRSILSVPIISRGLVLGVVSADSEKPDAFDEHEIEMLKTLANHVAQALESQRFRDVSISLSTLGEEGMYKSIVKNACILTGTQVSTIFLREGDAIKRAAVYSLVDMEDTTHEGVRDDGITRRILDNPEPVVISDAESDPDVKDSMKARGVKSLMGVPLNVRVAGGGGTRVEAIGVLFVSSRQKRDFGERDREILESLASQAAVAITKTRVSQFQQSLLSSAFDAIIAVDEAGTVREFNDSAQRVLGYTREEAVGQLQVSALFSRQEDADYIISKLAGSPTSGRVEDINTLVIAKGGQEIPILLAVSRLDSGYVGFFRDQRDIARARRYIEQLEGLLEAVQAITKLTDMKSVLATAVAKTTELLKTDIVSLYLYDEALRKLHLPPERVGADSRKEVDVYAGPDHAARRIIRHGEAVFTHDAANEPLVNGPFVDEEGIVSCAACPLKLRDKVVGVLFCNYRSRRIFTDDERAMINLFASELAIAIENARLFNESERRAEQLEALNRATLGLTADLSTEDILQTLVDSARTSTRAEYTALGIFSADLKKLDPFVTSGLELEEAAKISHPPVGMGVLESLLKRGEVINVPDVATHPEYVGQIPDNHPHITSFLGVPIHNSQNQVIGDFYAANKMGDSAFSREDVTNLKLLATQAAFAMERKAAQESASATQTVNISFLLLSRWGLAVKQQMGRLEEYLNEMKAGLRGDGGPQIPQIIQRMSEAIHEMDVPKESLEFRESPTRTVNLSKLLYKVATKPEVSNKIQSTPVLALQPLCMVTAHELLLEFALNILVNNAVEAIKQKGGSGEIRVECQTTERIVQVHISDTGAGIPHGIRSNLYREPLHSGEGTGYGSLAAGMILKVHGGNIRIVSTGSEGTTINFWLPVAQE